MAYDILIKGGSIIDGTGSPMGVLDVGITDGKIADVGVLDRRAAKIEIPASGKYVTPGFIDITNHADTHLALFSHPAQESMLLQGVTTIVGGNCGSSLAPLFSPDSISGVGKWVDIGEININWTSVDEFLDTVERVRPGVNFATLVGYGTLRRGIVGDEARLLTLEERERMKILLGGALREGALGLSLGLAYGHERAASTEEIIDIARAAALAGGILKIHLRSEGAEVLGAVNEAVRIGREAGVSIVISHFKVIGKKSWHMTHKALELIEYARSTGAAIAYDVSPYHTTGSPLYLLLPVWARVGGFKNLFRRIDNMDDRRKIIEDLRARTLHYDSITVLSALQQSVVGRSIADIAASGGMSPEDAVLEIIRGNEGRVAIVGRTISSKNTNEAVRHAASIVASDGIGMSQDAIKTGNLTHPRSFGAFPHFWHRFVTDRAILSPEEAVAKMTSRPAEAVGIPRRGRIAKGRFADIAVFDPRLFRDRATYKNPFRYPAGMEYVIVNGKIAVEQGRYTGARAGEVLRKEHP